MINFLDILTQTPHQTLLIEDGRLALRSLNFGANPNVASLEAQYPALLDAETWAFIDISAEFTPEKLYRITNPTVEDTRRAYNAFCRHLHQSVTGVVSEDFAIGNIPLRRYVPGPQAPDCPEILFFHGGGFVVGNLDSHDSICANLAGRTGHIVTAVDYRLAPEHPFPAAFEDCLCVYRHLINTSDKAVVLCGDSAGGTLAAGISACCTGDGLPAPRAQILIYPYLGGDPQAGSYQRHRHAPLLNTQDMLFYCQSYYGDHLPINDVRALPMLADSHTLPPTLCLVHAIDPLADDGMHYCQRLKQAGVEQHLRVVKNLPHGTFRAFNRIKAVADSWDWLIGHYHNLLNA